MFELQFYTMKTFYICIASLILFSLALSSCTDTVTYANQVEAENTLISDYLKRNQINVITTFPKDTAYWSAAGHDKDYYKSASGLYFRLTKRGGGDAMDSVGNLVITRFEAYSLTAVPDTTLSNLSTSAFPNPPSFLFGSGDYRVVCVAFNEAASYMKRKDSEARIIVPSKIGFAADAQSIRPMSYLLRIKFQR